MQIIIKGMLIITFTAYISLSAYACEACSCDVCLSDPESKFQKQSVTPPANIFSMSYCAATYNTTISGTTIQPATGAGLYIGTLQLYYQHTFDNSLKGVLITPVVNRASSLNSVVTDTSSGLGDVMGLLRYTLMQGEDYSFTIQGGVKTATGSKKNAVGTSIFSPKLVVGTGSTDPIIGFIYTKSFDKWNLTADALYRITSAGYDGYQFGNILNWGVNGYYKYNDNLRLGLGVIGENAAPNIDTQGVVTGVAGVAPNTGLTLAFLQPMVQYISGNLSADVAYQAPIYRSMVGTQLALDNRITGSIRIAF